MRVAIDVLKSYFKGQAKLLFVLGLIYSAGLTLLGVPFAVIIGMLAGMVNIIPYFGFMIGILLALLSLAIEGVDYWRFVAVPLFFVFVSLLENFWLSPLLVGGSVGLPFLVAFLAVMIGGFFLGPLGMIFAVPVLAVLRVFFWTDVEKEQKQ